MMACRYKLCCLFLNQFKKTHITTKLPRNYHSQITSNKIINSPEFLNRSRCSNKIHVKWNNYRLTRFPAVTSVRNLSTAPEEINKKLYSEFNEDIEGKNNSENSDNKLFPQLEKSDKHKLSDQPELQNLFIKEDNLALFEELAQGDPEVFNELRLFQMKLDLAAVQLQVTPVMTKKKWIEYLNSSRSAKKSFLLYILKVSIKKSKKYDKKSNSVNIDKDNCFEEINNFHPTCYHLFHNSLFMRIHDQSLRRMNIAKGITTLLHSPELFIDCCYESYMTLAETKYLSKQIAEGISYNLNSPSPFHLVLCNFNENSNLGKYMQTYRQQFYKNNFPVTTTEKSYLDIVPKKDLVYLTPHCNTELKFVDPNKRYIIGGFVDKVLSKPVSLGMAKKNDIAMAKFPLDRYLSWTCGKKSLAINHVIKIMVDYQYHKDWTLAFKIIPNRFIKERNNLKPKNESTLKDTVKYVTEYAEEMGRRVLKDKLND